MKAMRALSPYLLCLILFWIPACKCSQPAGQSSEHKGTDTLNRGNQGAAGDTYVPGRPNPIPAGITASGAMELSDEMRQNLMENFDKHLEAQNRADFRTYVSYYYKPMLDILNADSVADYMQKFHDMGCRNVNLGYEVDKISPIVETDSTYVVMLRTRSKLDVIFDPKFDSQGLGTAEQWGGQVHDRYPTAVWDPANRTYHVEEKLKFYCITPKDTLDFRFLMHSYYTDKRLEKLLDYETFYTLRTYEK